MSLTVGVLTGGTNSHQTTSEEINGVATDYMSEGAVGTITNTSGVAPATGAFAVNAQGTPDMTVAVSSGYAYVTGTPTSGTSQLFRVHNSASSNVTISANSSGSTKYDWVYIKLDPDKLANPAVGADDVATLVTSRSSSAATDDGTPPTYGYNIAVVTVSNGASSITNGNIADKRVRSAAVGGLNDTNGNEAIKVSATASAVNEVTVTNAATGNHPRLSATGGDTNPALDLRGQGTGGVLLELRNQAIASNATTAGLRTQFGWTFSVGSGGTGVVTKAITFPTAFSAAPVVTLSSLGGKDTSDPTAIGDFTVDEGLIIWISSITTTGFNIKFIGRDSASTTLTTRRYGFSWAAIGAA